MRPERFLRFAGLGLVLLFPLLSVLQLGEVDHPWREAAKRAQPAVLGLYDAGSGAGSPELAACGVVVQADPPRVVVAGRVRGFPLRSRHQDGWMHWRVLLNDGEGEFTVLQAERFAPDPGREAPARLAALVAAASVNPDPEGRPRQEVRVALVAPPELPEQPLWVGVLRAETSSSGRSTYTSNFLHPVDDVAALGASEAHAQDPAELDPMLRGAPFVDEQGNAVAVLVGRDARGMRAVAVETVVQSLLLAHLQAAAN